MENTLTYKALREALSKQPRKGLTALNQRRKGYLNDWREKIKEYLEVSDINVPDVMNYLVRCAQTQFPNIIADAAKRNAFFKKVGIGSYPIIGGIVDKLDTGAAPPQCYSPQLWLTLVTDEADALGWSAVRIIVTDIDTISSYLVEMCNWIYKVMEEARNEGCFTTFRGTTNVNRVTTEYSHQQEKNLKAITTISVAIRQMKFVKKHPKSSALSKEMKDSSYDVASFILYKRNLSLKAKPDTLQIINQRVDNLLDAFMPSEEGYARKLRKVKLQSLSNMLDRLIFQDAPSSMYKVLSPNENLEKEEPVKQEKREKVMNREPQPVPQAPQQTANERTKTALAAASENKEVSLASVISNINLNAPEGNDKYSKADLMEALRIQLTGLNIPNAISVYQNKAGLLNKGSAPGDMGIILIKPDGNMVYTDLNKA